ncbi:MAG: ribosome-associated translation inhibitor RaiA [Anaerolineales bacterium]
MAIKLVFNTRNMDLSEKLREYVVSKVEKLDRFLDILDTATIDLTFAESARSEDDRQVAQITVRGKGVMLRAEERTDDIFVSVDAASDKLLRQIERYKGRHWNQRGDRRTAAEVALAMADEDEPDLEETRIVRRKHFMLQPMDEFEAMEQMDLLGHRLFFVYLDANSGQVNVLYRRRDDTFGLIETVNG